MSVTNFGFADCQTKHTDLLLGSKGHFSHCITHQICNSFFGNTQLVHCCAKLLLCLECQSNTRLPGGHQPLCPGLGTQVVQPQDAHNGSCPVLRIQAAAAAEHCTASPAPLHDHEPIEQQLIPWVPAIVQSIHARSRTVVITPPPGLLELGRQQLLLQRLKPQLMALGKPTVGSMADRLGQHFMPTKRQLTAAGREDLVKLIAAAGGFIHVAHLLGLRAKRKPEGQQEARQYVQPFSAGCVIGLV